MTNEAYIKQFEEVFGKRLDMLEAFYQNHHGEPWQGKIYRVVE